jgi:hypothetical protein
MKAIYTSAALIVAMILAGCTTSSQVQEMIDASHRDYLNRADAHEASIDVLKKSAMTGLEKSKENAAELVALQASLEEATIQLKIIKGYAEASKVMSAANTVAVSDLEIEMTSNKEELDATTKRLEEIDKLYEEVLVSHYQTIIDSATKAMESLKSEGWSANTNAPVKIDEPIEIVAPDTTSVSTNEVPVE